MMFKDESQTDKLAPYRSRVWLCVLTARTESSAYSVMWRQHDDFNSHLCKNKRGKRTHPWREPGDEKKEYFIVKKSNRNSLTFLLKYGIDGVKSRRAISKRPKDPSSCRCPESRFKSTSSESSTFCLPCKQTGEGPTCPEQRSKVHL